MLLLITYITIIGLASYFGGYLSSIGQTTHRRAQFVVSFIAGFILGLAIFHLLPHALEITDDHDRHLEVMIYLVAGVVVLIFVLHVFHFHTHETLGAVADEHTHIDHPSSQHHHAATTDRKDARHSVWALAAGLGIHTIIEGVTLGVTVELKSRHYGEAGLLPGLALFIAIIMHKPLDAYSVLSLSHRAGYSKKVRFLTNLIFALICPVVAVISYFSGLALDEHFSQEYVGLLLAFAAGAFLCIALSDLLPEIQFHSHDRGWLVGALLLGLVLSLALFYLEVFLAGHDH